MSELRKALADDLHYVTLTVEAGFVILFLNRLPVHSFALIAGTLGSQVHIPISGEHNEQQQE